MKQEAFELADELDRHIDKTDGDVKTCLIAVSMMLRSLGTAFEDNGEPVAWMQVHWKTGEVTRLSQVRTWEDDIPLYTSPEYRELTEYEIAEAKIQAIKEYYNDNNFLINDLTCSVFDEMFARAVLKKAQGIEE